MKSVPLSRSQRMLVQCVPISEDRVKDRAMRAALHRARRSEELALQRNFDRAIAALVGAMSIPTDITEFAPAESLIAARPTWRKQARHPAFLATGIAVAVIAAISVFQFVERLNRFPGEPTARRLLTTAASMHSMMLDPVKTNAGTLGDFFFMKHRLAHYDVPPEFAGCSTIGCRVFDDEEGRRVAQIWIVEKRMQFFLFPAERDPKTGKAREFSGWRYVDQERWTGVVKQQNGVCFMAALRGGERELAPYISKQE
jgi:hypothetical protein